MNDTPNPYEVTFLEEEKPKPIEARFLRSKPTSNKITGEMIVEVTNKAFRSKYWKFFGLGLLQVVLLAAFFMPIFAILVLLDIRGLLFAPFTEILFISAGILLCCCGFLAYILTIGMNLRLLRGEKIFLRPTWQGCFRLFVATLNSICYILICGLMFLPAYVLIIPAIILLDRIGDIFISDILLAVLCLGMVLFCLLSLFLFGRYAVGLHYIVDRNVGCLTALRRTARFTCGNITAIALSFTLHFTFFYFVSVITLGLQLLAMPGYLHCWMAVTYLITTNQYEKPTASDISEW